ncbi:MAG: ankyrin repeat domain-containing protein [Akkermansia sp.]|nr:ankyrin repeat domain-containing protein [Akkermansia sp.]
MACKIDSVSQQVLTAAEEGDAVTLRQLLAAGARCNVVGGYCSRGPLTLAAQKGHLECVKLLIEYGADIQEEDIEMDTPITLAASNGHTECVRYLLEKGADVDSYSVNGTPLIQAARCGSAECMQLLLNNGANVHKSVSYGTTSLKEAIYNLSVECVKLLVEHGAKVTDADDFGFDEMMLAVQRGNEECVRLVLAAGGNPAYIGKHLEIALFDAVNDDDVPRVRELLKQGADVNFRNAEGETVLFRALQYGTPCDCLPDILAATPDETIRNSRGYTAWEQAKIYGALHTSGLTVEDLRKMPLL